MKEKLTKFLDGENLAWCFPDRWKYDERKYFYCDFLEIEDFVECVKSYSQYRPILIMEKPDAGWNFSGMDRPKDNVVILAICYLLPNILVRLFLKDDLEGLDKRLERESAQEAEALGDV